MHRFIKKIVLFVFVCLAPLALIQAIVSYRIKDRILYVSDNLDQTVNINADLVFLGSSRCCSHFDPVFFDTTFHLKSANIGVDGHSELTMTIIRFKNYLSKNKAPKFVIVNFDPLVDAGSLQKLPTCSKSHGTPGMPSCPAKAICPLLTILNLTLWKKAFRYMRFANTRFYRIVLL